MSAEVFTRVAKDPTTYALPPIIYTAHRLDWDSSQKLFAHGYPKPTRTSRVTGRVNDVPISYAAGKRRILRYSAAMIGRSALNNGICALVERRLIERSPEHRTLIRTLGWIERGFITPTCWSRNEPQPGRTVAEERAHAGRPAAPRQRPRPLSVTVATSRIRRTRRSSLTAGAPIIRKHGLGPARHRPSPGDLHRRGDRRRARLGAGQSADPRLRGPTLPERLLRWPGQHRFARSSPSAGVVHRPPRRSGEARGLAGAPDRVASGAPAVFGDTWSFAGQVWWNARAFLAMWAWWWTLMIFPALLVDTGAGRS